jgi:hypothetical protein
MVLIVRLGMVAAVPAATLAAQMVPSAILPSFHHPIGSATRLARQKAFAVEAVQTNADGVIATMMLLSSWP